MHFRKPRSYLFLPIPAFLMTGIACSGNNGQAGGGSTGLETTGVSRELLAATSDAPPQPAYSPVQVLTSPDAQCVLSGDGMGHSLHMWANNLGVVQLGAIRAQPTDAVKRLSLACTDDGGQSTTYAIDLTSDSTFQPLPPIPIPSTVHIRPALTGDPMQYTWEELLHLGYGSRPDPTGNPREYARWLKAASVTARRDARIHPGTSSTDNNNNNIWTGGLLDSSGQYNQAYGNFTVPTATVTSGCTAGSLWDGIGGYGHNDLIQTGVEVETSGSATYNWTWLEYASGNGVGGYGYSIAWGLFLVSQGDEIFANPWACDSSGHINASGGYGCFFIEDENSAAYADCYLPKSTTGPNGMGPYDCYSLPQINTFVGATAEAIIENNASSTCPGAPTPWTWLHFGPSSEANITLTATRTDTLIEGTAHNYTTDSAFALTLTNGSGTAMDEIAIDDASPDGTSFYWLRGN